MKVLARNTVDRCAVPISGDVTPPAVFCWTKMGAESGQGLQSILHRKELERESGGGLFSWGIGNSVGPALAYARQQAGYLTLRTLFTAMKSAPKSIDVSPEALVMWRSFLAEDGSTVSLPKHMLVTSRQHGPSGAEKQAHYALICRSATQLGARDVPLTVDGSCVRNLVSGGQVGHSQVTSVVRYSAHMAEPNASAYPVIFDAELAGQWFVRLVDPVPIAGRLASLYGDACAAQSSKQWIDAVRKLKGAAVSIAPIRKQVTQSSLFQGL